MSRLSAFCLIIALGATGLCSCNSEAEDDSDLYTVSSSVLVKDFSLTKDDDILPNLDKVFFSIDLANATIFNADSMPYGTDIHALIPKITTNGVLSLDLIIKRPGKSDTTINYLENSTDSIDFSHGPVTMRLKAYDEKTTMDYTVKVNVHQVKSDSLVWGEMAFSKLPSSLTSIAEQQTVKLGDKLVCMTSDGSSYCVSVSDSPASDNWQNHAVTLGFKPRVETLRATADALYILDDSRKVHKSNDEGLNWTQTSMTADGLIGAYGSKLLATVNNGSVWSIISSDGTSVDAPAGFPVSGSSIPVEYSFSMSDSHQLTIVGGKTADGSLTSASWGFDGTNWAQISNKPLPTPVEGLSVFPYFIFEENSYWVATKNSIFIALGGKLADGTCNRDVYISYDLGLSWKKAPELMQLPQDVPAMAYAQAYVFDSTLKPMVSSVSQWTDIAAVSLPSPRWSLITDDYIQSRASTAITSWQCPYIYMFGGKDAAGNTFDTVWRAVINRFTFEPLQ